MLNKTNFILANGIHIEYDIRGKVGAQYILCLHSLGTSWVVWNGQLDLLYEKYQVIRFNLRGHGKSEYTAAPYSLELLVDDAIALLDELGIEHSHVMGLSIGGMIALGMAIHHPTRVNRLIVADARAHTEPQFSAIWDNAIELLKSSGMNPVIELSLERWFSARFRESCPEIVRQIHEIAVLTPPEGFIGCARAVQKVNYLNDLDQILAPTLFIVGQEDRAATPEIMRHMANQVKGAEFAIIPGAAHLTPIESPNIFTTLVVNFLNQKTTDSVR